jgi:hypothetical protein
MKENRNEVEIQGTVEEAWEALTNFAQYSEWNPLIYRVEGKLEVGEKVEIFVKKGAEEQKFTCEVARLDPPHEFSWKFYEIMPFLYRGEHIFRVEPIDDQKVRFVDREIFEGLLVPLRAKNLGTNVKTGMVAMGRALKEQVEKQREAVPS